MNAFKFILNAFTNFQREGRSVQETLARSPGAGAGQRGRGRRARRGEAEKPGRRAQQKTQREARILRAAEHLFGRRGYAETSMHDVARRARVAVGTIYNYFPSKAELVLALLRRETHQTLSDGDAVLAGADSAQDAGQCVNALLDVYVDLVARHEREQLRELFAAALANPETIGKAAFEMDLRLLAQLHALLATLQARGLVAADTDVGEAALVLYGNYASWLFLFAASDAVPLAELRRHVKSAVRITMRGLLPG